MTKEKNIIDFKLIGIIFVVVMLFVSLLLPYNYCSDYYNLKIDGYTDYANYWFASSGRTVGMATLYLFDYLNVEIEAFVIIMKILAILIATITIYTFINMVYSKLDSRNENITKKKKILVVVASLLVFLNMGGYQFFYYSESAIMWLSVLLTVLAVKHTIDKNNKLRFIKGFLLLFVAMNCYQSTILLYIPAALLFVGIDKENRKELIKETIKLCVLVAVCFICGYAIIQGLIYLFNIEPFRDNTLTISLESFIDSIVRLLFLNYEKDPNYFYAIIYLILFVISKSLDERWFKNDKSVSNLILFFIIASAFFQIVVVVALVQFYIADRIVFAYFAVLGLIFLYYLMYTDIFKNNRLLEMAIILATIYLWYMIIKAGNISVLNRYARYMDSVEGYSIVREIKDYENASKCKVTKIIYCMDESTEHDWPGLRVVGDPTYRIFAGEWVIKSAVEYYSGNKIESCIKNQYAHEQIFNLKNWDSFDEEQIEFDGDTMYFCMY